MPAVGYRDLRPESKTGHLNVACARHADPHIKTYEACIYCTGPVKKGSLRFDDSGYAHRTCHEDACK